MTTSAEKDCLESLRQLLNKSIDTIQEHIRRHGDGPLDIGTSKRHPLRDRYDAKVSRALKCVSSAGILLRAICEPEVWLHDVMFNFTDLTALFVACQADVATFLSDGALDATIIARKTGVEAGKMSRHLRALCNIHVFKEIAPDVYENNELSLLLQSESRRALVGLCAEESRLSSCKMWEALTRPDFKGVDASNKAAFNIAYDTDLNIFQYWEQVRPDLGERGARAFAGKGFNHEQYFSLYPWMDEPDGTLLVDVGGGVGGATLPIVNRFGNLRVIVQDLPANHDKFLKFLHDQFPTVAKSERAKFQAQNFFESNGAINAPIYFLRHVLHDWQDDKAVQILSNLSTAMSPSSKVLICEHIVLATYPSNETPDDADNELFIAPKPLLPNWGAAFTSRLDLHVLSCINSKQRTRHDFETLVAKAGLEVTSVWRNLGDEAIIECHLL